MIQSQLFRDTPKNAPVYAPASATSDLNVPLAIMSTSPLEEDFHLKLREKDNKPLPSDLQGHVFFVAPVGSLDQAYGEGEPLFNGYGRLYRLDFNCDGQLSQPGQAFLSSKLARPLCFYADKLTQGNEVLKFRDVGLARLSPVLGFYNELNTAFLPFRFQDDTSDRLMLTWDVGRPYEIDPTTLEVVTPIGTVEDWTISGMQSQWMFPLIFSTAHPVADLVNRREVFTVQYGGLTLNLPVLSALQPDAAERDRIRLGLLKIAGLYHQYQKLPAKVEQCLKALFTLPGDKAHSCVQTLKQQITQAKQRHEQAIPHLFSNFFPSHEPDCVVAAYLEALEASLEHLPNLAQLHQQALEVHGGMTDDHTYVLKWEGGQHLQRWKVFYEANHQCVPVQIEQTLHQIGLTEDYVVLMDTSFKLGLEGIFNNPFPEHPDIEAMLRDLLAKPQKPNTVIYIIRRVDLQADRDRVIARRVEIPREAAHYVVDYENPNQQITLHLAHNCASDPAEWVRAYDQSAIPIVDFKPFEGMLVGPTDVNMVGRYVIDAETGILAEGQQIAAEPTWGLALYTGLGAFTGTQNALVPKTFEDLYWISWGCMGLQPKEVLKLYQDYPYRQVSEDQVLKIAENPDHPETHSHLFRVQTGANDKLKIMDSYRFGRAQIVNSPQFVPRAQTVCKTEQQPPSRDGYLVCNVVSSNPQRDGQASNHEIWIFDAVNLAQGPLYRLQHPDLCFGFTLHTAWLSEIQSLDRAQLPNYIDPKTDFVDRVGSLAPQSQRELMQQLLEMTHLDGQKPADKGCTHD